MRKIAYFFYISMFRYTPEIYRPYALFFPALRKALVKAFVNKAGKDIRIKRNADVSMFIEIGDCSELGSDCIIQSKTKLGNYVIMGPGVKIYTKNHGSKRLDIPIALQEWEEKPVTIGDDVWIGANVVILPGVNIGSHSILAAGAVVTKDIPEYSIAGGVPAKVIKNRKGEKS